MDVDVVNVAGAVDDGAPNGASENWKTPAVALCAVKPIAPLDGSAGTDTVQSSAQPAANHRFDALHVMLITRAGSTVTLTGSGATGTSTGGGGLRCAAVA